MAWRPRILIVDDEKQDALLMGEALTGHGYEVKVTRSPQRALSLIEEWPPTVLVLDVHMPEMGGIELGEKMREALDDPFIIFVTSDETPEIHDSCLKTGDEYIVKPFTSNDLYLRIKSKLDRLERQQTFSQPLRRQPGEFAPLDNRLWRALASGKGEPVSRDELMRRLWGDNEEITSNALDRAISRLREQIEPDPGRPIIIITVRKGGYRIDVNALREVKRVQNNGRPS